MEGYSCRDFHRGRWWHTFRQHERWRDTSLYHYPARPIHSGADYPENHDTSAMTTPNLQDKAATAKPARTTPKGTAQPGRDIVVTTAFELIGVSLLTLLAGTSDNMGTIVIISMAGFTIGWLIINSAWLKGYLG